MPHIKITSWKHISLRYILILPYHLHLCPPPPICFSRLNSPNKTLYKVLISFYIHNQTRHVYTWTYADRYQSCSSLWISARTNLFCLCMVWGRTLLKSRLLIKQSLALHTSWHRTVVSTQAQPSALLCTRQHWTNNNTVKIYLARKKTLTQGTMIVGHFPQTPRKYHAKDWLMTLLFCAAYLLYCPRYIR